MKALQLDFEQHLHLKWKIIWKGALEVGMLSELNVFQFNLNLI